jgi:hypothetical protein
MASTKAGPLMEAAQTLNLDVVKLLIAGGANAAVKDTAPCSPLSVGEILRPTPGFDLGIIATLVLS